MIAVVTFLLLEEKTLTVSNVVAYETTCPEEMTDQQCLQYLQEQAQLIYNDKKNISNKISQEAYNQLDLYGKISYLQSQIKATENEITKLEIELNQKTVEIRLLNKNIESTQNNIDTASQEINKVQESIRKRIALSYKYSSISTLEFLLDFNEVDSLLRKLRYLKETKEKDRELLAGMSDQIAVLQEERKVLEEMKEQVKVKLEEAEKKKLDLNATKLILNSQNAEFKSLYTESEKREADYRASYAELKKIEDAATANITQMIFEMFQSGTLKANTPVNAGDIIGFQGYSGMTFGAHLHFEYRKNGVLTSPNSGCFGVALHTFAYPINCRVPMNGAWVSQYPHYDGPKVDLVSYTMGNQTGQLKYMPTLSCAGYYRPAGYYSVQGTGAPIYAIKSGKITTVRTDVCGGRYLMIDHGNGETSLYLHLN